MNYIKAKFLKGEKPFGRAYTYRCEEELKAGDMITDAKESKLIVVDEPVDMTWVEAYGADKVAVVKKYANPESGLKIGDMVVMNGRYHVSEKNKGKVFIVRSEPQEVSGTMCVWLDGYSGCYAVDGLDKREGRVDETESM